jgi:hypothetical protein
MPEVKQIVFSHREVAEALIRKHDLHEGLWGIYVEFGLQGANIGASPDKSEMLPAAIVPVVKLGIQRFDEANSLTVDAAKVNPPKKGKRQKSTK